MFDCACKFVAACAHARTQLSWFVIGARSAGATWAPIANYTSWLAKLSHTSIFDATGNIYVLGGGNGVTGAPYNDVWRSTDGGEAQHRLTAAQCMRTRRRVSARALGHSMSLIAKRTG